MRLASLPPALVSAAALALGALLPLAFAPWGAWPLAVAIPAAMIALLRCGVGSRRIFLDGWLFGCGYFAFGVYWIYHSLHDFGMAPPLVAGAITAALVLILALFPAAALAAWRHVERRTGPRAIWLLPLFWFGLEWLRGWILTGLPWLSLGYSQVDSPLAGYAPLIGVFGIGALCMALAVALYLLLAERRYPMLALLLLAPALGLALGRIEWTRADGRALDVALVQGNIPQEIKWRRDQRQNIFNTYWRETEPHWGADLIVWPETALPGTSIQVERPVLQPLEQTAIEAGSALVTGMVYAEQDPRRLYNSAVLLGEQRAWYHKRHLVLFGEYYPLRFVLDWFSSLISIPYSDLTPGPREQALMAVDGVRLGLSICFEDVFSRDIRLALPAAHLLVNLTNDAWFGNSTAPHQHLEIARMRALEFGRPLLRSSNTGVSAFIDHRGRVGESVGQFVTGSARAEIRGRAGATPFYFFSALQPWLAPLPFVFAWLAIRRRRRAG